MKHFVKDLSHYKRDWNLLATYVEDQATHMSLMTGEPIERCREFAQASIAPGGRRQLVIPLAHVLVRNKFGDRERKAIPFDRLLEDIRERREILSPSMTAYTHPDDQMSILAEYIQGNLKKRKEAKHAKFVAEMKGEAVLAAIFEAAQTTLKIKNNSLSGAQCSPYTVLWNKSAHSTLTSTCRTATSYGNANNEKFLMGNRHYWSPEIVKANIISIINHSDYPAIQAAMSRHNLRAPTVEETMGCITRSTEFYWRSPKAMEAISTLVSSLTELQRSAFVFTSDLYHLAQVNPTFVREFFTRMSIRSTENLSLAEADRYVSDQDDNLRAFISMLTSRQLRGGNMQEALVRGLVYTFDVPTQNVGDQVDDLYASQVMPRLTHMIETLGSKRKPEAVEKLHKECRALWNVRYWERHGLESAQVKKYRSNFAVEDGMEANDYGIVGAMIKQATDALDGYQDLIQAFWVTPNLPASVYYMPSIIRRTAITSDTDSTIFTVQYWTEWYVGKLDFSETSIAVANTAVYLAGQLIRHILASFSGNMGVAVKDLNRLSMKNEYYFPVFVLTARAKHYFAYISAQEGNVFKEMKMEIKGVGLRNSNVAASITKASHKLMRHLMDSVMREEAISIKQVLRYVAKKEMEIRESVFGGKFDYLKSMNIKSRESYSETAKSTNYDQYLMWEEVFGPKYGSAGAPPYRAIKIPMDTDSPSKLKQWLDNMGDRTTAKRMEAYLKSKGKKGMKQLMLPESILATTGLPEELLSSVNIRGTIAQIMEGFYIILECLGYYRANDYNTKLVSDDEWLLDPNWEFGELNLDA